MLAGSRRFLQAVAVAAAVSAAACAGQGNASPRLAYDLVVAPSVDPALLRFDLPQADRVEIDSSGGLVARIGAATTRHGPPLAYQTIDGVRRDISVRFTMAADGLIGFMLGPYDRTRPLIIEPEPR